MHSPTVSSPVTISVVAIQDLLTHMFLESYCVSVMIAFPLKDKEDRCSGLLFCGYRSKYCHFWINFLEP